MAEKTQPPMLKWAQRKDRLFITIMVVHTKKPNVEIEGKKLKYKGTDGKNNYSFDLELYDEIDKDGSKYTLDARNIFLNLHKKTSGPYWPRLTSEKIKYHWIEVDWAYFVEEDEEEESKGPNFEGQDFGDMGGEMDEDDVGDDAAKKDENTKEENKKDETKPEGEKTEEPKKEGENKPEAENKEEKKADLSDLDKEETK